MVDHLRFGERTPSAVAMPNVRGAMIPPVLMRTAADIRRNECAVEIQKKNPDCYCDPDSGAGNQSRTDDLVITNDVLYQLSYTSIPADLHSIPHNDVFVKWFCKNILRSSKQVLIAEIFKFTDGCHGCSAVLTPRKPVGFCQGISRFATHAYIIPFFSFLSRIMSAGPTPISITTKKGILSNAFS